MPPVQKSILGSGTTDSNRTGIAGIGMIPPAFCQPDTIFVLIPAGIKFPPIEAEWQKKRRTIEDAARHLEAGGNIGVVAGDGYIGLDLDDPSSFEGIALPETTTWETRPGRFGMRFRCHDKTPELLAQLGKKPNLAQFKIYDNGRSVGEIKLERTYQVIPPSIKYIDKNTGDSVEPGSNNSDSVSYIMTKDIPPAEISLEWLLRAILQKGLSFSQGKSKEKAAPKIDTYAQMSKDAESNSIAAYASAAFDSEIKLVRAATEGNRNIQLNETVFKLAWFIEEGHLPKGALDEIYVAAMRTGLSDDEIRTTIKSAFQSGKSVARDIEDKQPASICTAEVHDIYINDRYLKDMTDEVMVTLVKANHPPTIFSRAGALVRTHENGSMHIEPMTIEALKNKMTMAAGYRRSAGKSSTKVTPPTELAAAILALDSWPGIQEIKRVIETPTIRPDGSILSAPGYDEATQLYLDPIVSLDHIDIPERPTVDHAKASAKYILEEIFSDFPFENEASKANVLALMLSVIVRPMITGNVPMTIIDKPQAGTGASLITDIIATVTTGKPASMWGMPETEDEWRKSITGALMAGSPIIVIDNIVGKLRSSSLTRALTSQIWRDRVLGKNSMIDLPQEAVWIATGNNIQIGGDIARRSVWIRLDAACARPWTRSGFRHEDILAWIKENHDVIIAYLIVMARAWIVAGKPPGKATLGGFSDWAKTIGGILEYAGVDHFLENAIQLYDEMDQDVQQWDAFLQEWSVIHGDSTITARQLVDELTSIEQIYITFKESMPDDIAKAVTKDRRASLSIGQVLRKHLGQVYPSGRKLLSEKDPHTKILCWKVAGIAGIGRKIENRDQEGDLRVLRVSSIGDSSIRENISNKKCMETTPAIPAYAAMDSDCAKMAIPAESDGDMITVTFLTPYSTDMEGIMTDYKEGDKATVARSRAEAWQKRGVVRI